MQFKINEIDENGQVNVTFTLDDKSTVEQNIIGLPVDNEEALTEALTNYGIAYQEGKAKESVVIAKEVNDMIGQKISINA